jgi:hypothetical protein
MNLIYDYIAQSDEGWHQISSFAPSSEVEREWLALIAIQHSIDPRLFYLLSRDCNIRDWFMRQGRLVVTAYAIISTDENKESVVAAKRLVCLLSHPNMGSMHRDKLEEMAREEAEDETFYELAMVRVSRRVKAIRASSRFTDALAMLVNDEGLAAINELIASIKNMHGERTLVRRLRLDSPTPVDILKTQASAFENTQILTYLLVIFCPRNNIDVSEYADAEVDAEDLPKLKASLRAVYAMTMLAYGVGMTIMPNGNCHRGSIFHAVISDVKRVYDMRRASIRASREKAAHALRVEMLQFVEGENQAQQASRRLEFNARQVRAEMRSRMDTTCA